LVDIKIKKGRQYKYNVLLRRFLETLLQWKSNGYYTNWGCVFVTLVFEHAMRMRRIVICDLPRSAVFFHIISSSVRFSKKTLLNTKCVFWFSLQLWLTNFSF